MTKFERIIAALEALPEARRGEIADILERLFYGDLNPDVHLNDDQIAEIQSRLDSPGPIASAERVAKVLGKF